MGFVTPVLVNNDYLHEICENPAAFVAEIKRDMNDGPWGEYSQGSRYGAKIIKANHSSETHVLISNQCQLYPAGRYEVEGIIKDTGGRYRRDQIERLLALNAEAQAQLKESAAYLKVEMAKCEVAVG